MDITCVGAGTLPWAVDCGIQIWRTITKSQAWFSLFSYIQKIWIFTSKYPDFQRHKISG